MSTAGPGEEATPAAPLDRAKIEEYLETFTADRQEAWDNLIRAQQRYEALTRTVAGFQKLLEATVTTTGELLDYEVE